MSSPQVGDAPTEPRIGADVCDGYTRFVSCIVAPITSIFPITNPLSPSSSSPRSQLDDWVACCRRLSASIIQICGMLYALLTFGTRSWKAFLHRNLLHSLRMEQRGCRLKEPRDFFNLLMPKAKAPLRGSIQAILQPASIRCTNATSSLFSGLY